MSEGTTPQILDMIEASGGSDGLDLSDKDLSGIDLSREAIQAELQRMPARDQRDEPHWWSQSSRGIRLVGVKLISTNLSGADLTDANLKECHLRMVNLDEARVTAEQLTQAASLHGVVLPDGTKLSDGVWEAELRAWQRRQEGPRPMLLLPKP